MEQFILKNAITGPANRVGPDQTVLKGQSDLGLHCLMRYIWLYNWNFHDILYQPLGAVDYLEISKTFDTVIVRNIPKMTLRQKSEAKRFTVMIDTFYDNKVRTLLYLLDLISTLKWDWNFFVMRQTNYFLLCYDFRPCNIFLVWTSSICAGLGIFDPGNIWLA